MFDEKKTEMGKVVLWSWCDGKMKRFLAPVSIPFNRKLRVSIIFLKEKGGGKFSKNLPVYRYDKNCERELF